MPLQPKTISNDLIERLNDLRRAKVVDLFALRKLETEAEKLKKLDAAVAYIILGMIACIKNDDEAMRANHLNAIKLHNNGFANFNFAASLMNSGYLREATSYLETTSQLDIDYIEASMISFFRICQFRQAGRLLAQAKRMQLDIGQEAREELEDMVSFLNATEIQDTQLTEMLEVAVGVLKERKLNGFSQSPEIRLRHIHDEETITFDFVVDADVETLAELNIELAEHLVVQFPDTHSDKILFGYKPLHA